MNNVNAAIGRGNLESLDALVSHRNELGQIYGMYGLFTHIWLAGGFVSDYTAFKQYMAEHGYEIAQYHYRNDINTIFGGKRLDLPVMNKLEGKYFFVPLHHGVTEKDAHEIGRLYSSWYDIEKFTI